MLLCAFGTDIWHWDLVNPSNISEAARRVSGNRLTLPAKQSDKGAASTPQIKPRQTAVEVEALLPTNTFFSLGLARPCLRPRPNFSDLE